MIPWNVYPRPQMRRENYVNLNGDWELSVSSRTDTGPIRVPYCPESRLSGVETAFPPGTALFYRRSFSRPAGQRVLLHIGAADQTATVFVNQKEVGRHRGGYNSFTCDITDALQEENTLVICCQDGLDKRLPYGKQCLKRGGMWYTPVSGIWQTVWLEGVPEQYIRRLSIRNRGYGVTISIEPVMEGTVTVAGLGSFPLTAGSVTVTPETPHLWSPEDPWLYDFTVETAQDRVSSYFALRQIQTRVIDGLPRLCLNGRPYFFHGLLDQGYWPDGIYTPEAPEAYAADILAMKKLGFNTLRKHIKVEPEEFYYQCDRLGMVVFQDMVNNGDYRFFRDTALPTLGFQKLSDKKMHRDPEARQNFLTAMEETVAQLGNHPCILYWTVFNEGWGQFDADSVFGALLRLDDSRIIDTTSGWFRQNQSHVDSRHIYFTPWSTLRPSDKPLVLSEFGGYACPVPGHLSSPDRAYGYRACKHPADFQASVETLYRQKVLPAVKRGLCAAIITQLSDVEEEINGFLTYDRQVNKADAAAMQAIARELQQALETH